MSANLARYGFTYAGAGRALCIYFFEFLCSVEAHFATKCSKYFGESFEIKNCHLLSKNAFSFSLVPFSREFFFCCSHQKNRNWLRPVFRERPKKSFQSRKLTMKNVSVSGLLQLICKLLFPDS